MENSRLEIRRFHGRYLVSRDHATPERVKALLDDTVTRRLPDTLSSVLSRCCSDSDPHLWFIRRLDFSIDVNAEWDKEPLSRAWARELATNVYAILQDGADGENVLCFPSRAAYLTRFLVDVAAGRAWTKWYYESFLGLRVLSTSSILRTALCENPEIGLAALHRLPAHELKDVLQALTTDDGRTILDAVALGAAGSVASSCFVAARDAWERMEFFSIAAKEQWRNALRLYVEASRQRTDVGGPYLKAAVVELSRSLPPTKNLRGVNSGEQAGTRLTPFGGMFLLLPLIDELPLAEATVGWPNVEEADAATLARFLLLLKCCGRWRAEKAFDDPLLRDLMGIAPSLSPSVLAAWQKTISVTNRKAFLKIMADWHDEQGVVTAGVVAGRNKLRKDLAYLSLPRSFGLSRSLDQALSAAAQGILRTFARRLPGFSGSRLPYLYGNFLNIHARVTDEADRSVVQLSRPPLYLVLNLAGMCNQNYRLSWLDERLVSLFSRELKVMAKDTLDYLSVKLQRLDILLHREILRLRANYQLSLDEFRGLYISDEQVNQLINRSLNYEGPTSAMDELTTQAESLRAFEFSYGRPDSPWQKLVTEFSLSPIEQDILLLAVAREMDLKYETLLAYLNNDITRKWPTFGVAMRVCAATAEDQLDVRRCLQPQANLFRNGLLQPIASATEGRSWLATGFSVAPVVPHYLSGTPCLDSRLTPFVEERKTSVAWEQLPISSDLLKTLRRLPHLFANASSGGPIVILSGRSGSGRGLAAEAVCHELGLALLRVDLEALRASGENASRLTQAILLQQRLQAAGLLLTHCEALSDKEARPFPESHAMLKTLAAARSPIFIACDSATALRELLPSQRTISFHFDDPQYATRLHLWKVALAPVKAKMTRADLEALADRFALTPGQIATAVSSAIDAQAIANPGTCASVNVDVLFAAARVQSDQSLGSLAVKVKTMHTWEDLVLPHLTLQRIREITAAIQHRHIVYSDWGFEKRIAAGLGLKVLLSGASGTGKTMTASVVARELGLDLYKIDLSSLVSKYIGETEKNLDRIFRAAQCSNAILFFDEADALFGKRSETKDAHDRYANIEVAYLLQKIEEYDGVVILASNLSQNIDEAFSRRMHYVVEFPLPDESHREKLWRGMFPTEVPLGEDVNFQFLAKQFQLAGGDIRNVALDAAFLAAKDGRVITMKQLVVAMARQMMKQGKIASPTDFKQYHALITQGE